MSTSPTTDKTAASSEPPALLAFQSAFPPDHDRRILPSVVALWKKLAALQAERPRPTSTSTKPSTLLHGRVFYPPSGRTKSAVAENRPRVLITDDGSPMRAQWWANDDTPPKQTLLRRPETRLDEPLPSFSSSSGSGSERDEDSLFTLSDDEYEDDCVGIKHWDARSGATVDEDEDKLDDTRRFWTGAGMSDESGDEYDNADDWEAPEPTAHADFGNSSAWADDEDEEHDEPEDASVSSSAYDSDFAQAMDDLRAVLDQMDLDAPVQEPIAPALAEDMTQVLLENVDIDAGEDEHSAKFNAIRRAMARARRGESAQRISIFEDNLGPEFEAFLGRAFNRPDVRDHDTKHQSYCGTKI